MTDFNHISIIGLNGAISIVLIVLIGFLYHRKNKLKAIFSIIWKKSSSFKPQDILGTRPFHPYYYQRQEDQLIRINLHEHKMS